MKSLFYFFISYILLLNNKGYTQNYISEEEALKIAIVNFPSIKAAEHKIQQQKSLLPASYNFYNTQLLLQSPTGEDMRLSVTQIIEFPTVYTSQRKAVKVQVATSESEKEVELLSLRYQVKSTFNNLLFAIEKEKLYLRFDSLLHQMVKANELRFRVGQIALLEKTNGEARYQLFLNQLRQATNDRKNHQLQLSRYLGKSGDTSYLPNTAFRKNTAEIITNSLNYNFSNPLERLYENQVNYSKSLVRLEKNRLLPGLMAGYFNQTSPSTPLDLRFNYGITLPVALWAFNARIKSAKHAVEIAQSQYEMTTDKLNSDFIQLINSHATFNENLKYFEITGTEQADQIRNSAEKSFRSGAISYYFYVQNIDQAFQIDLGYLDALKNYNQSLLNISYIKGDL